MIGQLAFPVVQDCCVSALYRPSASPRKPPADTADEWHQAQNRLAFSGALNLWAFETLLASLRKHAGGKQVDPCPRKHMSLCRNPLSDPRYLPIFHQRVTTHCDPEDVGCRVRLFLSRYWLHGITHLGKGRRGMCSNRAVEDQCNYMGDE